MKVLLSSSAGAPQAQLGELLSQCGYSVTVAADADMAAMWRRGDYSVVVTGLDGIELCRQIRAARRPAYTCILLIAGDEGRQHCMAAIDAGADDFIVGALDPDMLAARLRMAERTVALHDTLSRQSARDPVTGLANRATLIDSLQRELARAARGGVRVSVTIAEIDALPQMAHDLTESSDGSDVNALADEVLREAARRMQSALRSYDRIGRTGDHQFVIVAASASVLQTHAVAQRVCASVQAQPIESGAGHAAVSVSVGIAISRGDATETAESLLTVARRALLRAQRAGGHRVELAERADYL